MPNSNTSNRGPSGAPESDRQDVQTASLAQPMHLLGDLGPDSFDPGWTSASGFFNSKEAENYSMYQLDPGVFGEENFDFTYDFNNELVLPNNEDTLLADASL